MATDGADLAVTRDDIPAARARIEGFIRRTPVLQLGSRHPELWLKLESLQTTGSFKARGALNNLLSSAIPRSGVVAASGGNQGQARRLGSRPDRRAGGRVRTHHVPEDQAEPPGRLWRERHDTGDVYDESLLKAEEYAARTGARLIHPFDQPETVAGAGSLALEFLEQAPALDTMLVAVGGGGLLTGRLIALTDKATRVVAAEPSSTR